MLKTKIYGIILRLQPSVRKSYKTSEIDKPHDNHLPTLIANFVPNLPHCPIFTVKPAPLLNNKIAEQKFTAFVRSSNYIVSDSLTIKNDIVII